MENHQFLMGKLTISMAILNSYAIRIHAKFAEGNHILSWFQSLRYVTNLRSLGHKSSLLPRDPSATSTPSDRCSAGSLCHRDRLPISTNHRRVLPRSCIRFPVCRNGIPGASQFWSEKQEFLSVVFVVRKFKRCRCIEATWCWETKNFEYFLPSVTVSLEASDFFLERQ